MREIRFRAWDKRENTMRDVAVLHFTKGGKVNSIEYWKTPSELKSYHVRNLVLMQSTGLKDKHGFEIYEGDIVRYFRNELAVIVYRNGGVDIRSLSWGDCEPLQRRLGEIEVIGNIYQNNDLLEG